MQQRELFLRKLIAGQSLQYLHPLVMSYNSLLIQVDIEHAGQVEMLPHAQSKIVRLTGPIRHPACHIEACGFVHILQFEH